MLLALTYLSLFRSYSTRCSIHRLSNDKNGEINKSCHEPIGEISFLICTSTLQQYYLSLKQTIFIIVILYYSLSPPLD